MKKRNRAFTLIELIAVLVIMAIIALIVTPLVMNIIRKARISADKRSVDAYGRSIELAIASHLLETGDFPTSIDELTIEYSGDEVACSTTQLNSDSSVYLAGCTVGGRSVEGYTYGKEEAAPKYTAYEIGDEVSYNNVDYYVIADSDETESTVKLLKAEPLTVDEVNQFGAGHVNKYTTFSIGTAANKNGYGSMAYYASETCGYVNNRWVETGCTADYAQSEIKYVVDAWASDQAPLATEARLITFDELMNNLGYENAYYNESYEDYSVNADYTPSWVYNSNYSYWTSSLNQESQIKLWYVETDGRISQKKVNGNFGYFDGSVVRPIRLLV